MDELEKVIRKATQFEEEQRKAAGLDEEEQSTQGESGQIIQTPDELEAAKNMAESLLRTGEKAIKAFVDRRLEVDKAEVEDCRESMAPFLSKYGLAGSGDGLPYQEEVSAGFYLGGLWKRVRRALAQLKAIDKKKAEEKENGNQREHQTQESARLVSGKERIREESNTSAEGWSAEEWGSGGPVGQQQGPQGA